MSKNTPAAVDAAPHRINPRSVAPDAKLLSTPDTILWGYIAANLPPALTIKPGQIVEIEALSHQGLTSNRDPESFFAGYGIPAQDVLPDAKAVFAEVKISLKPTLQFILHKGKSTKSPRVETVTDYLTTGLDWT